MSLRACLLRHLLQHCSTDRLRALAPASPDTLCGRSIRERLSHLPRLISLQHRRSDRPACQRDSHLPRRTLSQALQGPSLRPPAPASKYFVQHCRGHRLEGLAPASLDLVSFSTAGAIARGTCAPAWLAQCIQLQERLIDEPFAPAHKTLPQHCRSDRRRAFLPQRFQHSRTDPLGSLIRAYLSSQYLQQQGRLTDEHAHMPHWASPQHCRSDRIRRFAPACVARHITPCGRSVPLLTIDRTYLRLQNVFCGRGDRRGCLSCKARPTMAVCRSAVIAA
jgi:hypothetical protein